MQLRQHKALGGEIDALTNHEFLTMTSLRPASEPPMKDENLAKMQKRKLLDEMLLKCVA